MTPRITQLNFTDIQLAAVMNAVQLVLVVLRLHADVQTDGDYAMALAMGLSSCDSHSFETWQAIHNALSLAAEDITDPRLTPIAHVPESLETPERFGQSSN